MAFLATDPLFLEHRIERHPECPERLTALLEHLRREGWLDRLTPLNARDATEDEIALVHDRDYIREIRRLSDCGGGWLDGDTYLNERSHAAALRAVGAVLEACDRVLEGSGSDRRAFCAVRPPGHHATPARGMGFCLFNSVAIAARRLKRRVLVVDWDVHHGNGTQDAFADDPGVAYFSTHRSPFYPGTGLARERGRGNILNVPMDASTPPGEFHRRFSEGLAELAASFRPEFLLVSCGFDAYRLDPIGGLNLEPADFGILTRRLTALELPLVSVLEGGYSLSGLGPCAAAHVEALLE
jgi:acetoin utilization deacetylase AcuC-like enzyme